MIGKIITGKSFGGCIAYNLNRDEAIILDSCGVRTSSVKHITDDFNMQCSLNSGLAKAVGHIILSWSANDAQKLDDGTMVSTAKEYMDKMKIVDTQYLIVKHTDRDHPHVHLIYNRVNNCGKTITDRFQKLANIRACKEITLKHGYYLASDKTNVNRPRLKGIDKAKYEMHDAITKAIKSCPNWSELSTVLKNAGVDTHFKYLGGTNMVQGVSFSKGEFKLKGSEIDRALSFGKINAQLEFNAQRTNIKYEVHLQKETSPTKVIIPDIGADLLGILLGNQSRQEEQVPYELRSRKRKLRKGQRL